MQAGVPAQCELFGDASKRVEACLVTAVPRCSFCFAGDMVRKIMSVVKYDSHIAVSTKTDEAAAHALANLDVFINRLKQADADAAALRAAERTTPAIATAELRGPCRFNIALQTIFAQENDAQKAAATSKGRASRSTNFDGSHGGGGGGSGGGGGGGNETDGIRVMTVHQVRSFCVTLPVC